MPLPDGRGSDISPFDALNPGPHRLNPAHTTIVAAATALQRNQTSPRAMLADCLQQIDRREDTLHAWVFVDREGALAAAEALEREPPRSALHGIPLGVKDIIDVAGMPTRCGSTLTPDHDATRDAPMVAALRRAGAIVLGKTVTTPFAYLDPQATANPWNVRHTPGGSSSGSAAAVASGMCMAALGTQTGGSLIRPAAYCGLAALKPTHGLFDTTGIFPLAESLDHPGPMARCVADLALMMSALLPGFSHVDAPEDSRAPRLGWLGEFFLERADDDTRRVTRDAQARLEAAGAQNRNVTLPASFARVHEMHMRIMSAEAARHHAQRGFADRGPYPPRIAELLAQGQRVTSDELAEARELQAGFRRDIEQVLAAHELDALIMPATPGPAPSGLESTGDPSFNSPWSFAGLPVVTFPVGLTPDALPLGLQLVGAGQREARLLATAAWCERQLGFSAVSPPLQSALETSVVT